jgi:hypothetical protein
MKGIISETDNLKKENENLKNKLAQREAELALISSVS